jgi:hypothetical protein
MASESTKTLRIAAAIGLSFMGLIAGVILLLLRHIVTFEMALLMLVALFGLYFGFGVLIVVYRFVSKLD